MVLDLRVRGREMTDLLSRADKLETHLVMTDQLQMAEIIQELTTKVREQEELLAESIAREWAYQDIALELQNKINPPLEKELPKPIQEELTDA